MTKQTLSNDFVVELAERMIGVGSHSIENEFYTMIEEKFGDTANYSFTDDLTIDQFGIIDDIVFECTNCGWYFTTSEGNEFEQEVICDSCYEELTEEEE